LTHLPSLKIGSEAVEQQASQDRDEGFEGRRYVLQGGTGRGH